MRVHTLKRVPGTALPLRAADHRAQVSAWEVRGRV